jgi:hypothetical protein
VSHRRLHPTAWRAFHEHWLRATGRQQWLWFKQLLHLSAAGWPWACASSIVLGGIVRQYPRRLGKHACSG